MPGKPHGQRNLAGYTVHGVARVRHDLATKQPPIKYREGVDENAGEAAAEKEAVGKMTLRFLSGVPE